MSNEQDKRTSRPSLASYNKTIIAIGATIGAVIAIWSFGVWLYSRYVSWQDKTPQAEYKRLESLEPGVQVRIFSDRMGVEPQSCRQHGNIKTCTYVKPNELVQVAIDEDEQVLAFSVTVTTRGFTPTLTWAGRPIVLGKTSIEQALSGPSFVPDRVTGYADMRSWGYLESSGSFGVANFQECAIGVSNKGYVDDSSSLGIGHPVSDLLERAVNPTRRGSPYPWPGKEVSWASREKTQEFFNAAAVQDYRRHAIMNTMVLTAPNVDVTTLHELVP